MMKIVIQGCILLSLKLTGLKITALHMEYKRNYRVNRVRTLSADKDTFELDDGNSITVKDYFAQEKKIQLK